MKAFSLFFLFSLFLISCGSVEQKPTQDEQNLALLEQNVASSDLALVEGKRLLAAQEFQKAEKKIRESKAKEAPFYLALTLQELDKKDEAKRLFEQSLKNNIQVAESYYNLAMMAHQAGNETMARSMAQKAVESDNNHAGAHFILGSLAFDKGNYDEALKQFTAVTKISKETEAGWSGVANVLALQHNWEQIWNIRKELITFPSLVIFVAQAAEKTAHQKEGITLLHGTKMNLVVALQYIVLLSQTGKSEEAFAIAQKVQKSSPGTLLLDRDNASKTLIFLNPEGEMMFVCGKSEPTPISLDEDGKFVDADKKVIGTRADVIAVCGKE